MPERRPPGGGVEHLRKVSRLSQPLSRERKVGTCGRHPIAVAKVHFRGTHLPWPGFGRCWEDPVPRPAQSPSSILATGTEGRGWLCEYSLPTRSPMMGKLCRLLDTAAMVPIRSAMRARGT